MNTFSRKSIKIMTKLGRFQGAAIRKEKATLKALLEYPVDKDIKILDFGAGKAAYQTEILKSRGYTNVTAYDFTENCVEGIHNPNALDSTYDIVMASNVLNIQPTYKDLYLTLEQLQKSIGRHGKLFVNYPDWPRNIPELTTSKFISILKVYFNHVEQIRGSKSSPVLLCVH